MVVGTGPRKKHLCPQNGNSECILMQFLTGIKKLAVTRSLGTWILWFSREKKLIKTVQKVPQMAQSSRSEKRGSSRNIAPPPEYATVPV